MTMDLERVARVAAGECIRQHVGIERLITLLEGYDHAVRALRDRYGLLLHGREGLAFLGGMIEPDNHGRFRTSPVTFRDGGTAAPHADIERLLFNLFEYGDELSADEWTKQFLWIHPFTDGNGRTAWVVYNVLNGSLDNPVPLPEFF